MIETFIQTNQLAIYELGKLAGTAAFIAFTFVICMGLLQTSKLLLKFRFMFMSTALSLHSFTATFIGLSLLALHIGGFVIAGIVGISAQTVIPFYGEQTFFSTSGLLATYISIVLVTTARLRNRLPYKVWRTTHYLSFVFYVMMLYHVFNAGFYNQGLLQQVIYLTSMILVVNLILLRIFGKKYMLPNFQKPLNKAEI